MATIVLQAAGAFVGSALGPVGAVLGRAAGALAGYTLDQAIINGTRRLEGPRLNDPRPFSAEDGAALPRAYGSVRLSGTLIWATRFEEEARTERQGGKGGPKVTNYSYFANVAFALCEGPISGVRRIWADGREIDQSRYEIRLHRGTAEQDIDPLIETKQGAGNAPAYRDTAIIVLERFPLDDYGNRVPQFQFEVIRSVGALAGNVRAITLIPGSTEYGLSPSRVTLEARPGETEVLNRHILHADTDFGAALDELQAVCPNLKHVGLVATWFGTDLRAGECQIIPGVTQNTELDQSQPWLVSGIERAGAYVVSQHLGSAAYGGSPSDQSVIDAIREIKARGLEVTLYPFIMMDVPHGNALPNPYGGDSQSAYPWRGRISCHPAPGISGSVDGSATAAAQVAAFIGGATASDFSVDGDAVAYAGADDWGYRRFLLHFAHLTQAAGGVDAFLIGSELRGLTSVRNGSGAFPFVGTLTDMAAEVRAILGPATKITYGADWSEYFGYQPPGTADMIYNLDPLWAHPAIDAVGIDNYMPLADWRDADYSDGNPDGCHGPYDPDGLRAAVAGGEGYDWYYASTDDRHQRLRSPISDGAYGKPWIYRCKDIVNWWSNPHYNRIGGVEAGAPTAWVPEGKPVWFTELGCPASDKGPNQPNVFPDPKSAESALPYYSTGGRSDVAQRRFIEAHQAHWDPASPTFEDAGNPLSPEYGGRLVDPERVYLWSWDARPFPAFPQRADQWSDGDNWLLGHWLNGRLSTVSGGELIDAVLADHGLPPADTNRVDGSVHGYIIDEPSSARAALEPIIGLFGINVRDDGGRLRFESAGSAAPILIEDLVLTESGPLIEANRVADGDLPTELTLAFRDPFAEYQAATARSTEPATQAIRQQALAVPAVLETSAAVGLLDDRLRDYWAGREEISIAVPAGDLEVTPGAVIRLPAPRADNDYLVTQVEFGTERAIRAKRIRRVQPSPWRVRRPVQTPISEAPGGPPHALLLDLPTLPGADASSSIRVAAHAKPWKTQVVLASAEMSGFGERAVLTRPARIGQLVSALSPGPSGRVVEADVVEINLLSGALESVTTSQVLNGANLAAVLSDAGDWELLQFEAASEIAPGRWRLERLLRGQLGTEDGASAGAAVGAAFVMVDQALSPVSLTPAEQGLVLNWRVGPTGYEFSPAFFREPQGTATGRAAKPLAPGHLRYARVSSNHHFSWIRRGRIGADGWEGPEIPVGEESEAYVVELRAVGGPVLRTVTVSEQHLTYTTADALSDFGTTTPTLEFSVCQLSASVGRGFAATRIFNLT